MNQLSRTFALSASALAVSLLITACGGGDASPPPAPVNTPQAQAADKTAPTMTMSDNVVGSTATGDVTFTFTFSEDTGTSFSADDVVVTSATKGSFLRIGVTQATLVVSPPANNTGSLSISVAAGAFKDAAGNTNAAAVTAQRAYNTVVPVIATKMVTMEESPAPTLAGFGGAEDATVVVDPTNPANKVAKVVKSANAELWAGATVSVCTNSAIATIPFSSTNKKMSLAVWSPDAGIPVRLKVEDAADGGKSVETEATVTTQAGWQTLTFDFANQAAGTAALNLANTYNKASVFFNFGTTGAQAGSAKTYYFDDLSFVGTTFTAACAGQGGGGGGGSGTALLTFDEQTAPKLTDFGTNGAGASIVVDPAGGTNKVLKVNKYASPPPGSEQWAGTTLSTLANDALPRIAFTSSAKTMTARVWSPAANVRVRLKAEDAGNNGISVETDALTTMAGAWETLTFNFANPGLSPPVGGGATSPLDPTKTYNKLSIFMDFGIGNGGSGPLPADRVYYVDDISFVSGSSGGGGGGGGGTPLVFASDYSAIQGGQRTAQGGDAGNYIDPAGTVIYDWGGVASLLDTPPPDTPSYYFGWGLKSNAKPTYLGGFVKAPNNGTASITGLSNMNIKVWGNDELMNTRPTLTLILNGPAVNGCTSELKGSVAVTAAGVQSYVVALSSLTLQTACSYANAAAALAAGITQVNVQVLGNQIQFTNFDGGGAGTSVYPNGLNLGPITFN